MNLIVNKVIRNQCLLKMKNRHRVDNTLASACIKP